jgi:hypothetical protein
VSLGCSGVRDMVGGVAGGGLRGRVGDGEGRSRFQIYAARLSVECGRSVGEHEMDNV